MNVRALTQHETENLVALNESGCSSTLLFLTETGLTKALFDATDPMRRLFKATDFHNYDTQGQGQECKIYRPVSILEDGQVMESRISLYRPKAKKGDPRFNISDLKKHARPDNVCAVFISKGVLHLLNLTESGLASDVSAGIQNPVTRLLRSIRGHSNAVANELLSKLRDIASNGLIAAVAKGDTAIGVSVEAALGIPANSSKKPDYKGIELKSARSRPPARATRSNLFASVPNWNLSKLKTSTEIMEKFGYHRDGDFKLYCSVSTTSANSQGLRLTIDEAHDWLREVWDGATTEDVCIWELSDLHQRLKTKHTETFWIKAKDRFLGGREYFELESVTHTSRPSFEQFDRLIEDGGISVDHLIKRTPTGRGAEKGPLFKIWKQRIPELFLGNPSTYEL